MRIDISLWVVLKGVDLVAGTAFSTLTEKMGYRDSLAGLARLDLYEFGIESSDPAVTVARLQRVMAVQTIFYNRNKHNYSLECAWPGQRLCDGISPDEVRRVLLAQVESGGAPQAIGGRAQEFDRNQAPDQVMLRNVSMYRAEVLVEDRESAAREGLRRRLESELETAPVDVGALGTGWFLALRAPSVEEARRLTDEIVVTKTRERGLLLNPNNERYTVRSVESMVSKDV